MREGAPDPGLYDFHPYNARPKIEWPGGKTVAVWVAPNLEYYEIDPPAHPREADRTLRSANRPDCFQSSTSTAESR